MIFLRVRTIFLLTLPLLEQKMRSTKKALWQYLFFLALTSLNWNNKKDFKNSIHFKTCQITLHEKMQFSNETSKERRRNKSLFLHLKYTKIGFVTVRVSKVRKVNNSKSHKISRSSTLKTCVQLAGPWDSIFFWIFLFLNLFLTLKNFTVNHLKTCFKLAS